MESANPRKFAANAFESGARKIIPATLIYVTYGSKVLMLHRKAGKDAGARKWNGLGGKLEADESPRAAARRELREEARLDLPKDTFRCVGLLQFPNFKAHKNEDWNCYVFRAECSADDVAAIEASPQSDEGELAWIEQRDVLKLALWPGDRFFLPAVFSADGAAESGGHLRPFMATLWYCADGSVERVEGPLRLG